MFVKLQPYRQISLKRHAYHKLSSRYFGPFIVLKKIGTTTYQLDLPPFAKIHHTFHVSQLKLHVSDHSVVPDLPVTLSPRGYVVLEPGAILDTRFVHKGRRSSTQHLVK